MTVYQRDADAGIFGDNWPMIGPGAHRRRWRKVAREWGADVAYAAGWAAAAVAVFAALSWIVERVVA